MEKITDASEMRAWSRARKREGKTIAFVPTMGYLHEGHVSLVLAAKQRADLVVASIYVNPTQFARGEDFDIYPHDPQGDYEKLSSAGCNVVFSPLTLYHTPTGASDAAHVVGVRVADTTTNNNNKDEPSINPDAHETWVTVERLQRGLCGDARPTFFRGVATVVTKLFHIVEPDVALFGKKDYQQLKVITRMVRDLDFGLTVIGMPIVREADGLAMSSRNVRLKGDERQRALSIVRALREARRRAGTGEERNAATLRREAVHEIKRAGGRIDYVTIVHSESLDPIVGAASASSHDGGQEEEEGGEGGERGKGMLLDPSRPVVMLVAAHFGSVRLIDNMQLFGDEE